MQANVDATDPLGAVGLEGTVTTGLTFGLGLVTP
jgi:hypothetical protein